MQYDIKENNHPDWFNKHPHYNKAKMLGLNSFIKIMKLEKKGSWSYEKLFRQIPTMKSDSVLDSYEEQEFWID